MSRVAIFGDVCSDVYWIGAAAGISAEAPVPVIKQRRMQILPGMAGNVAALLTALGQENELVSPPTAHQPVKNRLVLEDGTQIARWDIEDWCAPYTNGIYIDNPDPAGWVPLTPGDTSVDAIIVSDYGKGSVTPRLVEDLLEQAAAGIPLFVDTKNDPFTWIGENITLFPNATEYARYQAHYDWLPQVVAKQGADGIDFLRYGKSQLHLNATCAAPLNVCGAGDAVISAFVRAALLGRTPSECLTLANSAAGLLVSRPFDQRSSLTWDEVTAGASVVSV